jgi:hypothetical protein
VNQNKDSWDVFLPVNLVALIFLITAENTGIIFFSLCGVHDRKACWLCRMSARSNQMQVCTKEEIKSASGELYIVGSWRRRRKVSIASRASCRILNGPPTSGYVCK